mgnify:CR=1 FL=1
MIFRSEDLSITQKETNKESKKSGKSNITTTRQINTELRDTNEYLSKQRELLEDISRIEQRREIEGQSGRASCRERE